MSWTLRGLLGEGTGQRQEVGRTLEGAGTKGREGQVKGRG